MEQSINAIWVCLLDCYRAPPGLWDLCIISGPQRSSGGFTGFHCGTSSKISTAGSHTERRWRCSKIWMRKSRDLYRESLESWSAERQMTVLFCLPEVWSETWMRSAGLESWRSCLEMLHLEIFFSWPHHLLFFAGTTKECGSQCHSSILQHLTP